MLVLCPKLHGEEYTIKSLPLVSSPNIKSNVVYYTIDFDFVKCPENHLVVYNKNIGKMIIDFYDATLSAPEEEFLGNVLFKEIEFKNSETTMSLTGERAQIVFPLDLGWHSRSRILDSHILRLTIWKELKPIEVINKKKKQPAISYILSGLGLLVAGVVTTIFLIKN